MTRKVKKTTIVLVALTITIGLFVIPGCGDGSNDDQIQESKEAVESVSKEEIDENNEEEPLEPREYELFEIGNYAGIALEWRVLTTEGNNSLLITESIIDYKPFNDTTIAEATNWEESTLRQWLNEEFYYDAFSEEERDAIQISTVQDFIGDGEEGEKTQDYVFILSVDQAFCYFSSDKDRIAYATDYAKAQIKFPQDSWWLIDSYTTTGLYKYLISNEGKTENQPRVNESKGVRPAIWIANDFIN